MKISIHTIKAVKAAFMAASIISLAVLVITDDDLTVMIFTVFTVVSLLVGLVFATVEDKYETEFTDNMRKLNDALEAYIKHVESEEHKS